MLAERITGYRPGHVRLESFSPGSPKGNEVLVETIYSAISPGTELAWLHHMANTPGIYPYYPGYSCTGRILETGPLVTDLKPGSLVAVRASHCSHFLADSSSCIPIDTEQLKPASAFRIASISLQGVRKADIQIGDRVAVLGLGAIGNFAAQLSQIAGAGEVIGFDLLEDRRSVASACNISHTMEKAGSDLYNSFDSVIEATGSPSAINSALKLVRPLGNVVLLGSPRGLTEQVDFYTDVHRKGIQIIGAHESHRSANDQDRFGHFRSNHQDEQTVILFLQQKRLISDPLISELVFPEHAQAIYDRMLNKEPGLILAAFSWKEGKK